MSNNNDANAEANDNNNEVGQQENLENLHPQQQQQQQQNQLQQQQNQRHHNHDNLPQHQLPPGHGHHALGHDSLNNQNNPPEWAAFPDLLRVQEPQQNGGGVGIVGGVGVGGVLPPEGLLLGGHGLAMMMMQGGGPMIMQRAGVANPPDVSLPGAAGRDPPPPDFDIDRLAALHNQRLPDMALDADQARVQAAAAAAASSGTSSPSSAAQHSLPDMALDASGLGGGCSRTIRGQCGSSSSIGSGVVGVVGGGSSNNSSSSSSSNSSSGAVSAGAAVATSSMGGVSGSGGAGGSGARLRPRRPPGVSNAAQQPPLGLAPPGSLARMAQAAAIGAASGSVAPVAADNNGSSSSVASAVAGPAGPSREAVDVELLTNRIVLLEAQVAGLRQQMLERDRLRAEESARFLEELSALRRSLDASAAVVSRDRDQASLENRLINMESLIQRLAQGAPMAPAPQHAAYEDVIRGLRMEEQRRRQRETERLARVLASSLQVAMSHFIDILNQDSGDDD